MSRRRLRFRAYLRRRWRAVGLVAVLLLGALLLLVATDRGHDPVWDARGDELDAVALAPRAEIVYAVAKTGDGGARLEARSGGTGARLWESPLPAPRALMRASDLGAVVATDFPLAFLTAYATDGRVLYQIPLEGTPRALAVEGDTVALALQARGNPVLVLEAGEVVRTHHFEGFVNALDLSSGVLAVATGAGEVAAFTLEGDEFLEDALPLSLRSARLSRDAAVLIVGGASLRQTDVTGMVALYDLDAAGASWSARWTARTRAGVGLVDLDAAGTRVLALEESPPRHVLVALDPATGETAWSHVMDGLVSRDDAGWRGGAAVSPDGSVVAAATLRGAIRAFHAASGEDAWSYDARGATTLVFARDAPGTMAAAGRLSPGVPYEAMLLFEADAEPATGRVALVGALVVAAGAVVTALALTVGFWRLRRAY